MCARVLGERKCVHARFLRTSVGWHQPPASVIIIVVLFVIIIVIIIVIVVVVFIYFASIVGAH